MGRERSKDKPPKLPPRDNPNSIYGPNNIPKVIITNKMLPISDIVA